MRSYATAAQPRAAADGLHLPAATAPIRISAECRTGQSAREHAHRRHISYAFKIGDPEPFPAQRVAPRFAVVTAGDGQGGLMVVTFIVAEAAAAGPASSVSARTGRYPMTATAPPLPSYPSSLPSPMPNGSR